MSEVQRAAGIPDAFGEVFTAFADDPPNGPRLRIMAAARRVLITLPLLVLVDAGESPWASLRDAATPCEDDPYGYRGSVLRIEAENRTVVYLVGDYVPGIRCYTMEMPD